MRASGSAGYPESGYWATTRFTTRCSMIIRAAQDWVLKPWGEYLRFSANYYQPLSNWDDQTATLQQRMARGYDVTAQARLPFYQQLNTSVSLEQYFGDSVDLFDTGTGYHNPVAVKLGLNYTPVPLVTLTAEHKQGESGASQNDLGLKVNYRFGVPLWEATLRQ